MIKEGSENLFALLILLIFYFKKSQNNLSLDNKNFKWGEVSLWNVFLKYTLDTIIGTPRNFYE